MKLTEVNKLKAYTRNDFSAEGDKVILTIKVNDILAKLLKKACVVTLDPMNDSFNVGENDTGETEYFNFKRYMAKTIFYRELGSNGIYAKNILYSKDLLDNGIIEIAFYSVYQQNRFLSNFQNSLKTLTELLIGENLEREISFNLSETTTAE